MTKITDFIQEERQQLRNAAAKGEMSFSVPLGIRLLNRLEAIEAENAACQVQLASAQEHIKRFDVVKKAALELVELFDLYEEDDTYKRLVEALSGVGVQLDGRS